MKRLITILALVLCSCSEMFVGEEMARPNKETLPDLTAEFAENGTRTYIENNQFLRWHEDDRLTVFYGNMLNCQYKFNGATGDNSGTFSFVSNGELGLDGTFNRIYAIYPYDETATTTGVGEISLTLPAVQSYAENSFGRGANTMIAVTENLEDTFLSFKNACGYLKLKLYHAEGATIKSIEVMGNNYEKLAGAATAITAFGEAPQLTMSNDATTSVTLDCGDGVALGTTEETATEFWIVLPATTFAKGLTIVATDTDDGVFKKSTTKEIVVERNAIQPMSVLETKFAPAAPADNEIWYTNGSTTWATTPCNPDAFGASVISNTYDTKKECWIIKFDRNITTVGFSAFYECTNITSVIIPGSVTEIGEEAFNLCSNLTSVTIGDGVTTIGGGAFANCDKLQKFDGKIASEDGRCLIIDGALKAFARDGITEYSIPNGVTSIEYALFEGCNSLTSITITDGVTTIGAYAFNNCSSLTNVTIPDSITSIRYGAFSDCSSLTSVAIPNGVTAIESSLFKDCSNLTSITMPDGVTCIGVSAFSGCSSLESITIPDSVTTIDKYAFSGCSSFESVTIPEGVTSIGDYAFSNCSNITGVYCRAITPPAAGTYILWNIAASASIYVPMESLSAYRSADNWKNYKSRIVGYDFEIGEVVPEVEPKPANNEIWYTNGSTTDATAPYYTNVFGANIISNTYDAGKECWVIKFDGNVTSIGDYAFYNRSTLTSVTFGDSVKVIGDSAFYRCTSLASITIPDNVTTMKNSAFENCSALQSVVIGNGVTSIESNAFHNCTKLTDLTIGVNVTNIGYSAFQGCRSLVSLTIPDSVTTIGDVAFASCYGIKSLTIGNSVTTIGSSAFQYCSSIADITIPDSVTDIGSQAFYGCTNLTSVTLPDNITTFGSNVFYGCNSLPVVDDVRYAGSYLIEAVNKDITSCTILDGTRYIGKNAFKDCTSLTSVVIPYSVTSIGEDAFKNCTGELEINSSIIETDSSSNTSSWFNGAKFTKLIVGDDVTKIGNQTFYNCSSLISVTIGDSVTTIGSAAFFDCGSLKSVTIGDSVTTIGSVAFAGCSSLTKVSMSNSVNKIESDAFNGCISLTSITLPANVNTIEAAAFYGCTKLASVYCKATTPPTAKYDYKNWAAFNNTSASIYVPKQSVSAYKKAIGWSEYESRIEGYDFVNNDDENIQECGYSVVLNNAWRLSSVANPDSSLYDGVYESYSNYHVNSSTATMYIDITGYDEFKIYVRSNGESGYDYVNVYELDSTSTVKYSFSNNKNSGTSISNYTLITFSNIDGGDHRICITYRKDGSENEGTDRGYLLIPKNQ